MTPATFVVAVAAILLIGAGLAKLHSPAHTAGALAASGLTAGNGLVRGLAMIEVALGAAALVVGTRPALVAVAVAYVGFALFVAQARLRRLPVLSCGCFASPDLPPRWRHAGLNAAASAVTLAAGAPGPLLGATGREGFAQFLLAGTVTLLILVTARQGNELRAVARRHA